MYDLCLTKQCEIKTKRFLLRPQARLPTVCHIGDDYSDLLSINGAESGRTTDEAVWAIRAQSTIVESIQELIVYLVSIFLGGVT